MQMRRFFSPGMIESKSRSLNACCAPVTKISPEPWNYWFSALVRQQPVTALAALGLAGLAVRSGARSTIATLWLVNDAATGSLMAQFYRELAQPGASEVEALRCPQLNLSKGRYKNPIS